MRNTRTFFLSAGILFSAMMLTAQSGQAKENNQKDLVIVNTKQAQFLFQKDTLCGDVTGMLHRGDVAYILREKKNCYYVVSGKYKGYIAKDCVKRGKKAASLAKKLCPSEAITQSDTIYVYASDSASSPIVNTVAKNHSYKILSEKDAWYKIETSEHIQGYIMKSDVKERTLYRFAQKPDLVLYADLYPEKALATYATDDEFDAYETEPSVSSTDTHNNHSNSSSSLGKQIADYACSFVGNPYVWGGTSLTDGIDCSAFVMRVYEHFGYNLPRTSTQQRTAGHEVSNIYDESLMYPGDIICYKGHVALYIGNGNIVHAANSKLGIVIGTPTYRSDILSIRRILSDDDARTYSGEGHGLMDLSDEDTKILERIVEAEAGNQGMSGKIYVADVILNRVVSDRFPNTVKDVVFSPGQFSPVANGRYDSVTVSEETKTAVSRAVHSLDTSNGALYFMYRQASNPDNVTWFDNALTFLFKYREHEFFK